MFQGTGRWDFSVECFIGRGLGLRCQVQKLGPRSGGVGGTIEGEGCDHRKNLVGACGKWAREPSGRKLEAGEGGRSIIRGHEVSEDRGRVQIGIPGTTTTTLAQGVGAEVTRVLYFSPPWKAVGGVLEPVAALPGTLVAS